MRRAFSSPLFGFGVTLVVGLAVVAILGRMSASRSGSSPKAVVKLKAHPFEYKEGKSGWYVTLPGNSPLATPAVADGKVFVSGFGSVGLFALDAESGAGMWAHGSRSEDPEFAYFPHNPSASPAVVDGPRVVVARSDGQLAVLNFDGSRVCKKRLAYPGLGTGVSAPAVAAGKAYLSFADAQKGGVTLLGCFDAATGRDVWKPQRLSAPAIGGPVVAGDEILVTTLDGVLTCYSSSGDVLWTEKRVTCPPAVAEGRAWFCRRESTLVEDKDGKKSRVQKEVLVRRDLAKGTSTPVAKTQRRADYLDRERRKGASELDGVFAQADRSALGPHAQHFKPPPQGENHLGQTTHAGVWSYLGSRPSISGGRVYCSMGDVLLCVDATTDEVQWQKAFGSRAGPESQAADAALSPPALANGKVFVGTVDGQVLCFSASDGDLLWRVTVGEHVTFPPAVANGQLYIPTVSGTLYVVETGDAMDHGWPMLGGNPANTGVGE